jgi:hypothetical protein
VSVDAASTDRPTTRIPLVVGILSIAFGSITALGAGLDVESMVRAEEQYQGIVRGWAGPISGLLSSAILGVTAFALAVLGMGLLLRQAWARRFTIYWAYVALLEWVVYVALHWSAAIHEISVGGDYDELVVCVPFVIYPILVLWLLSRPRVIAAMR